MRAKLYVGDRHVGELDLDVKGDPADREAPVGIGTRVTVVLIEEPRRINEPPLFLSGLLESL